MTAAKWFVVLLIIAGLAYALMYVGWLPRPRRSASSTGTLAGTGTPISATQISGSDTTTASEGPRALTLAWVDGEYLSTTMAISRQKHVAAEGMDMRVRANMVVDDSTVRWEREGMGEVRIAGARLLGVNLKRGLADMLLGQAHIVQVSWRADHGNPGERYVTGFLPHSRSDSAALVSAVQRLMSIGGASSDAAPSTNRTKTGPQGQSNAETTPDGTP